MAGSGIRAVQRWEGGGLWEQGSPEVGGRRGSIVPGLVEAGPGRYTGTHCRPIHTTKWGVQKHLENLRNNTKEMKCCG